MRKEKGLIILTPGEWLEYEKRKKGWFNEYVPYILCKSRKVPIHIRGVTDIKRIKEFSAKMTN